MHELPGLKRTNRITDIDLAQPIRTRIRLGQVRPGSELPDLKLTNRIADRIGSANKNKDKARVG
jgi:hypothetical protein